jgi:hypothetical protein
VCGYMQPNKLEHICKHWRTENLHGADEKGHSRYRQTCQECGKVVDLPCQWCREGRVNISVSPSTDARYKTPEQQLAQKEKNKKYYEANKQRRQAQQNKLGVKKCRKCHDVKRNEDFVRFGIDSTICKSCQEATPEKSLWSARRYYYRKRIEAGFPVKSEIVMEYGL